MAALTGIRVLDLTNVLSGPFCTLHLALLGADVVKIENPKGGDLARKLGNVPDYNKQLRGTSFLAQNSNKKSLTLNLKEDEGKEIFRKLAKDADVVVENFRPGVMEKWGLGPEDLKPFNPGLIFARISGYGQTGPYSAKPGYASVTEGVSGFRYLNGFPGQPPVRPNLSVGDTISAIHAALGVCLALLQRAKSPDEGQVVDVALYESMFNLMESGAPIVLQGHWSGINVASVDIDNIESAKMAVEHLVHLGHTQLGMIVHAPLAYTAATARLKGYQDVVSSNGFLSVADRVAVADFTPTTGEQAMESLLASGAPLTAVFVSSDTVAVGAMRAAKRKGYRIPDDISFIGFDDIPMAVYQEPPLTTVRLPAYGIGWATADLLIRLIVGEEIRERNLMLESDLIVRASCGRV